MPLSSTSPKMADANKAVENILKPRAGAEDKNASAEASKAPPNPQAQILSPTEQNVQTKLDEVAGLVKNLQADNAALRLEVERLQKQFEMDTHKLTSQLETEKKIRRELLAKLASTVRQLNEAVASRDEMMETAKVERRLKEEMIEKVEDKAAEEQRLKEQALKQVDEMEKLLQQSESKLQKALEKIQQQMNSKPTGHPLPEGLKKVYDFKQKPLKIRKHFQAAWIRKNITTRPDAVYVAKRIGIDLDYEDQNYCNLEFILEKIIVKMEEFHRLDKKIRRTIRPKPHPSCLQGVICLLCGEEFATRWFNEGCKHYFCNPCCQTMTTNEENFCTLLGCNQKISSVVTINTHSFSPFTPVEIKFGAVVEKRKEANSLRVPSTKDQLQKSPVRQTREKFDRKMYIDPKSLEKDWYNEDIKFLTHKEDLEVPIESRVKHMKGILKSLKRKDEENLKKFDSAADQCQEAEKLLIDRYLETKTLGPALRDILNPKNELQCVVCMEAEKLSRAPHCNHLFCLNCMPESRLCLICQ